MLAFLFIFLAQIYGSTGSTYPNPKPSTSGVFMGAYAIAWPKPAGNQGVNQEAQMESIEATTGYRFAAQLHYVGMTNTTASSLSTNASVQGDLTYGRMPWFSQTCTDSLSNIAQASPSYPHTDPRYKDYIAFKNTADALGSLTNAAGFVVPVGYRFFWEFNLCLNQTANASCANSDAHGSGPNACFPVGSTDAIRGPLFVSAWRNIHSIFVAEGASNVAFVWCPDGNQGTLNTVALTQYLPQSTPGTVDSTVDWIGWDVYDKPVIGWQALVNEFYNGYGVNPAFSQYGLPMILDETGENNQTSTAFAGDCVAPGPTGEVCSQANYFADMASTVPSTFPLLHAIFYFSSCPTCAKPPPNPPAASFYWSLDSGGLAGLATLQGEAPFNARGY